MAEQSHEAGRVRSESRPREPDRVETEGVETGTAADRVKRATAVVVGGALLIRGIRRRSLRGMATALVGSGLLYSALGGRTRIKRRLRSRIATDRWHDERTEATTPTVSRSITIGRPADELYEAWLDHDQFSQIVGHFAEVTAVGEDRFEWTVHGPRGRDISWETRIVEKQPGERIRWETQGDATLPNEGTVRFRPAPGDRGTEVTLSVSFDPPGGPLGNAALRTIDAVPTALVGTALGRFKSLLESGEIQTLSRNPSARGRSDLL